MPEIGVGPVAVKVQAVGAAVPPLSLVTVFTNVNTAGWSSLVIVHVAISPGANSTEVASLTAAPVHAHARRRIAGGARLRQRVETREDRRIGNRSVTLDAGDAGRRTSRGQRPVGLDRGTAVVVGHVFDNVNCGAMSSFVIVHVALSPNATAIDAPSCVPPTHDHVDAA